MKKKFKQVKVNFEESDFELLSKMADNHGMTKAQFIRNELSIFYDDVREPHKKRVHKTTDPQILYHLNKIGNNLNQIAKHLNEGNSLDLQVLAELVSIEQSLKGFLHDCND